MIASLAYIESWRKLLDERIPDSMAWYKAKVAGGTALPRDHAGAAANATQWQADIAAVLADSRLAAFQARFPDWTTVRIQAVQTSLAAVESAVKAYSGAALVAGAAPASATDAAQTLLTALEAQIVGG